MIHAFPEFRELRDRDVPDLAEVVSRLAAAGPDPTKFTEARARLANLREEMMETATAIGKLVRPITEVRGERHKCSYQEYLRRRG